MFSWVRPTSKTTCHEPFSQLHDEPVRRSSWLRKVFSKRVLAGAVFGLLVGSRFFTEKEPFQQVPLVVKATREQEPEPIPAITPLPPLYPGYREFERQLPQHRLSLPYPEGREGKYFFVANHCRGSGWGNVLQEQIFHAYLAENTDRAFVFDDYTWSEDGVPFSTFNGTLIPAKIPQTALIQGPMVGTRLGHNHRKPRSVSREFFDIVCPNPLRVRGEEIHESLGVGWGTAAQITAAWVEWMARTEERCIEVVAESANLYDLWLLGDPNRLLDVWPGLSASKVVTEFGWSPLIENAFDNNRKTISPKLVSERALTTSIAISGAERYPVIPGLLAMHIRRGDFEQHCIEGLARWNSGWLGLNSLPQLPDKFDAPPDTNSEEHLRYYYRHCYPSIEEIVERVAEIRRTNAGQALKNIYIMTNGRPPWVAELKQALNQMGGWESISSSRDLQLDWEQKYVSQAVDMLVGQRAEVFIGNGWSSLTACIAMLRMAYRYDPESTRFL